MGYYSVVTGQWTIEPRIRWSKIKDSRFLPENAKTRGIDLSFCYVMVNEEVETEQGTLLRKEAVGIMCTENDAFKAYQIEDDLRNIFKEITSLGSAAYGGFVRVGENQGDVERFKATGQALFVEQAKLVWPDGTEAKR